MSTTSVNTYIEALGVDIEELYEMSEAERSALYQSFYEEYGNDSDQYQALVDAFAYLDEELYVLVNEMERIVDDADVSAEEQARAAYALGELEGMFELTETFSDDFGEAKDEVETHDVDITDGSDYTLTPGSDVQAGEEFVIDASSSDVEDSTLLPDEHADDDGTWVDTNGDGYSDTLADSDDDGKADYDTNGDKVIDETDMLDSGDTVAHQTVKIALDDGDTVSLASYDSDTGDVRLKVTTEDGVVYYITVKGAPDIRFTGNYTLDTADIADTWAPELLHRVFENATITDSFGDILGVAAPDASGEYYSIYDLGDQEDNELDINIGDDDFENGREYEISCESGKENEIDLDFPEGTEVVFSSGDDGSIVITATNSSGEKIKITIHGFNVTDSITITDADVDTDSAEALYLGSTEDGDSVTFFVD